MLSKFGLVPAAAMGIDVKRLLETTQPMERSCGADVPPAENPGVRLGIAMGVAATRFGRDKVTIIASPGIADFGAWLEQLLGGEHRQAAGAGLIPLAGEPLTTPEHYGSDRFFAYLRAGRDSRSVATASGRSAGAGGPSGRADRREGSNGTSVRNSSAGRSRPRSPVPIIGINPFDQPDVEASKVKTRALTEAYEKSHRLPEETPMFRENGIALYADPTQRAAARPAQHAIRLSRRVISTRAHAGDYVALLAYIERDAPHTEALTAMRARIRDKTRAATCLGFGPRFQHSTGQAYKGGPNSGVFLQITCDDPADIGVPGHSYTFGVVKAAQAQRRPRRAGGTRSPRAARPSQGCRCGIGGARRAQSDAALE